MEKAIFSLAFLEYMHGHLKKDIVDSYIPLLCNCLLSKGTDKVDSKELRNAMDDIYGISNLTKGAIEMMCNRMASKNYGILKRKDGEYWVVKDALCKFQVELKKDDTIVEDFDLLAKAISDYSQKLPKSYSKEEVEQGLYRFLNKHDVDILTTKGNTLYSNLTEYENNTMSFLISKYALESEKKGGRALDILVRLAKGNAVTNLVSLTGLNDYCGKLDKVVVFIDTPFFYDILGAGGSENRDSAVELLTLLQKNGAHFAMFKHNMNEVLSTMDDAIHRLERNDVDPNRSSRLLRMALNEGYSARYLAAMRENIDSIVSTWNITSYGTPEMEGGYEDIDMKRLEELIAAYYTHNGKKPLAPNQENMLAVDVDSITYTYRIRGNEQVRNLKGCKAIMLTTNRVISIASNDKDINVIDHKIPVCATDLFLSAILWSNYPDDNSQLNRKQMISECYNNIQLDNALLARFFEDAKELRQNAGISENQYLMLTTSKIAKQLLGEKTMNTIDEYTDRTAQEILYVLEQEHEEEKERIRQEGEKQLEELENKHKETDAIRKAEYEKEQSEKDKIIAGKSATIERTEGNFRALSHFVAKSVTTVLLIVFIACLLVKTYCPELANKLPCWAQIVWHFVFLVLTVWSALMWSGKIMNKISLQKYLENQLYNWLVSKFMEE